ncbi:hypothetical protein BC828DRAFT_175118 [Blastocladiella britannica]|nr:hypothetical protein BC828DRAFT_175118 [Blastocladiella britannica]
MTGAWKQHLLLIALVAMTMATWVHGHGAITGAKGIGGPEGKALGIVDDTPRDGRTRNPFQQDTSIIRDGEIASGRTGPCGRTLGGGNNDITEGVQSLMTDLGGLPMVAAGQPLTMTVHQINADGAGPYTCDLSADGTGQDFTPLKVDQNLPGKRGRNARTSVTDQPLAVTMPVGLKCSGGPGGNMCLVRCRNAARAGPFGGCVPVQQMNGAAAGAGAAGAGAAGAGSAQTEEGDAVAVGADGTAAGADNGAAKNITKKQAGGRRGKLAAKIAAARGQ